MDIITKEEAARIAIKFWEQKANCYFENNIIETEIKNTVIDIKFLDVLLRGSIKSFQLQLRSIKDMTDAEKKEYKSKQSTFIFYTVFNELKSKKNDTAESIDYLRSIGVDTDGLKDKTIIIKEKTATATISDPYIFATRNQQGKII